mgnify:CR=1 FL=1
MNLNKLTKIFEIMKENLLTETIDKKNIANKKIIEDLDNISKEFNKKFKDTKNQYIFLEKMSKYMIENPLDEHEIQVFGAVKLYLDNIKYRKNSLRVPVLLGDLDRIGRGPDYDMYRAKYTEKDGNIIDVVVFQYEEIMGKIKEDGYNPHKYIQEYMKEYEKLNYVSIAKVIAYSAEERWYALEHFDMTLKSFMDNYLNNNEKTKKYGVNWKWRFDLLITVLLSYMYLTRVKIKFKSLNHENIVVRFGVNQLEILVIPEIATSQKLKHYHCRNSRSDNIKVFSGPEIYEHDDPEKYYEEKVISFEFANLIVIMILNYFPFGDYSEYDLIEDIQDGIRPDVSKMIFPEALNDLIKECYHKDPSKRPFLKNILERLIEIKEKLSPEILNSNPKEKKKIKIDDEPIKRYIKFVSKISKELENYQIGIIISNIEKLEKKEKENYALKIFRHYLDSIQEEDEENCGKMKFSDETITKIIKDICENTKSFNESYIKCKDRQAFIELYKKYGCGYVVTETIKIFKPIMNAKKNE